MNASKLAFVIYIYITELRSARSITLRERSLLHSCLLVSFNLLARYTYNNDFGRKFRIICKLACESESRSS